MSNKNTSNVMKPNTFALNRADIPEGAKDSASRDLLYGEF